MKSILFVTYGDSFRPPMALYILGHLAKDEGMELAVDSAHVKDGVGEPVTEKAITTLARYGIEGALNTAVRWNGICTISMTSSFIWMMLPAGLCSRL